MLLIFLLLLVVIFIGLFIQRREYYTTDPILPTVLVNTTPTALHNNSINSNFGNFGKIGSYPAIPSPDNCSLDFNCMNYLDDYNMSICKKCSLAQPQNVFARAVGKPRQETNLF